jgi:hypothetical protein
MVEKLNNWAQSRRRKAKAFYITQLVIVAPVMYLEAWKGKSVGWPIVVFGIVNLALFISAIAVEKICLAAINSKGGVVNAVTEKLTESK